MVLTGVDSFGNSSDDFESYRLRDSHSRLFRSLTRRDVASHQIAAFTEAFAATDLDSLDDLVETRREFAELIKLAIACQLIPIELESIQPRLYPDLHPSGNRDSVDWYRYLLNEIMLSSAPDLIRSNRLAVVTFNFDTTFEQRLLSTVKGKFGLDAQEAHAACKDIPVIHLHGQLDCHGTNKTGVVLQEDPELWQPDVVQSAARLKIASDEIETDAKDAAQSYLRQAKAVYFLGFGYHPTNLKQLGIPESINHASVAGTARGNPLCQ